MIKKIFFVFLPLLLIGCASTGGISDFYKSNYSDNELPSECYLKEGEEPEVYYSMCNQKRLFSKRIPKIFS